MGDATSLRTQLGSTDASAPAIQSSASSMMRLYDRSNGPSIAVSEWRNAIQSCQNSQLLPLLYVANEVLQTSKRNRGNKFLEAFGPVLGGVLKFICERDPSVTEKVRRTAKIWGDRRVFSTRFVGEVLAGLESYRSGGGVIPRPSQSSSTVTSSSIKNASLVHHAGATKVATANAISTSSQLPSITKDEPTGPCESDSDEDLFGDGDDDRSPRDDDQEAFGSSGPSLLNVSNFSVDKAAVDSTTSRPVFGTKRRRSLQASSSSSRKRSDRASSPTKKKSKLSAQSRRRTATKALSASSFMERIHQLSNLDAQYQSISNIISSVTSSHLFTSPEQSDEIHEVGDELVDLHTSVNDMLRSVKKQNKSLWKVTEGKREMELELKRYLVWMKGALSADEDELNLCHGLEEKLNLLQLVHADAKKVRDEKRAKEAKEKDIAEKAARRKAEEEELKRSLEEIKEKGAPKVGMVWNKQAREYQYLADTTEESWRD